MAIRINSGVLAPQYGRITAPRGTFLSNPSTAADGSLGGSSGMNPPTPLGQQTGGYAGGTPGYVGEIQNKNLWDIVSAPFKQLAGPLNNFDAYLRTVKFAPVNVGPLQPIAQFGADLNSISEQIAKGQQSSPYQSAFQSAGSNKPYSGNNAQIVSPGQIPNAQAQLGMPGLSQQQIDETMSARGYIKTSQPGVGEVWVRTGNSGSLQQMAQTANMAYSAETDARGRPVYVSPENLQPGERVTAASGIRYVGGTPYTDQQGTTVGQYARTIPNERAAQDTKGRYKWVSDVRKDQNGNWVRTYRQVLRKVYTRSHFHGGRGGGNQTDQSMNQGSPDQTQLVNLRANYG